MAVSGEIDLLGARIFQGALDLGQQNVLLDQVRTIVRAAPLARPVTPAGRPMSVRMSAAGPYGWFTDHTGYGYRPTQPNGAPWPPIPDMLLSLWQKYSNATRQPECCLVNWYAPDARMGLHQDKDEGDMTQPVLSISLGDMALFRMGGTARGGPTQSIWLSSGDLVVLGDGARLAYHGIDRLRAHSSTLLPKGGRINLTLRVVTPAPHQG